MADQANIISNDKEESTENLENKTGASGGQSSAGPTSVLPIQKETVEKWKKTLSFLAPLFACLIINVIAGIFFISFLIVVTSIVTKAFGEDQEAVAHVQNTFRVFAALSAASCAPLMIKYGFRKVVIAGSVLLIFSCISSSLTTTADILAIPFGFMGGIALGLLRTAGLVATLDYLHTRPVLALFISILCFTIGNFIGIFVFTFEMTRYISSSRRWPNSMRIFEVIAVIGLLAGSFLQKNSNTHQDVPKVFKHPPFYIILVIRMVASIGLSIILPSTMSLPNERGFLPYKFHPIFTVFILLLIAQLITLIILIILRKFRREQIKKAALLSFGILILVIGLATMFHQVALISFWPLASYAMVFGVTQAYSQTMLPVALLQTTGTRSNYKLVLPLLESVQEVGGLIGGGSMARIVEATSSVNGALYYAGVALLMAGVGAILSFVFFKKWPPLEDEPVPKLFLRATDNSYSPAEDIPGMETDEANDI